MNINRNNCEAFFLDYYEGTLSDAQVGEMFAFLKANPDLREAFESFAEVSVDTESTSVPDFSFLKKEPVADIHEQAEVWMVETIEGTISDADRISLENYLNENPSKRADLAAFENTVLRADADESFGDLSGIKKDVAITADNFEHYAIALIEGTISEKEKSLLESFVLTHPEFEVQLDAFRNSVQLADESVVFDAKESLKRTSVVVTKDNIDGLLVEKTEGQLAAHEEQAVDAFVAAHPEYKKDLDLLAKSKLVADTSETFDAKDKLKRGAPLVNESNFEQYAISAAEGLLNAEELKAFNAFTVTQPKYAKAAALYAATRVQPDATIVYADKAGLKRKEKGGAIWWTTGIRYAAAAVIVLLLGVYLWTKFGTNDQPIDPIANNDKVAPANNNTNTPGEDNVLPENNTNGSVAENNSSSGSNGSQVRTGGQPKENNPGPVVPDTRDEIRTIQNDYVPVTIVAASLPNKANDAVNFSDALYSGYNQQQNTQPVAANNSEYISPGQLAMRWMKDKIDGPDAMMANTDVSAYGPNGRPVPHDRNVDGMDITQSAVNRVGQSAANGNVAMEQRNDGTYLQLWNYEVRVGK